MKKKMFNILYWTVGIILIIAVMYLFFTIDANDFAKKSIIEGAPY